MIKTKDELLTAVADLVEDPTTDNAIAFLEDLEDTMSDLETRAADDGEDWEARYNELDREWRERYSARFFNKEETEDALPDPEPEVIDEEPKTFEELFIEEE